MAPQAALPRLRVAPDGRSLETVDGKPFVWLADTAWTALRHLDLDDWREYLATRRRQGFTTIQVVALDPETNPELLDVHGCRALGPSGLDEPQEEYFVHLDGLLDVAHDEGLYVALVPAWGQLATGDTWDGDRSVVLLDERTAEPYGRWIGARYRDRTNLVWVLGGDRHPVHRGRDLRLVWRRLAQGIGRGATQLPLRWDTPDPGWADVVLTYHPTYSDDPAGASSSASFHEDPWLSFNMVQSGHRDQVRSYDWIAADRARTPAKPVLDAEPNYEDWVFPTPTGTGVHDAWNVRKRAYWSLLAGSFGHSYGHACVWPMIDEARRNATLPFTWREALQRPGAQQMLHVKRLIEMPGFARSVPDQDLLEILDNYLDIRIQVRRAADASWTVAYLTSGGHVTVRLDALARVAAEHGRVWAGASAAWVDPRTGETSPTIGSVPPEVGRIGFDTPTQGPGQDWLLVIRALDGAGR